MRRLGGTLFAIALALSQGLWAGRNAAVLSRDARAEGLGGLLAVLQAGPLALGSNPAALAQQREAEAVFGHQSWLAESHVEDLAYAQPAGPGTWALQGSWFGTAPFDNTGGRETALESQLFSLGAAWGQALGAGFSAGASLAYQRQSLGAVALQDLALGLGGAWQSPWQPLRAGLALRQVGLWHSDSEGPSSEAVGGLSWEQGPVSTGLELQWPWRGQPSRVRAGIEWRAHPALALRSGVSSAAAPDQALAPDLGLRFSWAAFDLDWASTQRGLFGTTHAASLHWRFGAAPLPTPSPVAVLPSPTAAPSLVPSPPPSPLPTRTPAPRRVAVAQRPTPLPSPTPDAGFPLFGRPERQQIALNWDDGLAGRAASYDLYIGLVPTATMRRLNSVPLRTADFRADVGVRGMTYYFKVKALDAAGQVLAESRVLPVMMAKEGP